MENLTHPLIIGEQRKHLERCECMLILTVGVSWHNGRCGQCLEHRVLNVPWRCLRQQDLESGFLYVPHLPLSWDFTCEVWQNESREKWGKCELPEKESAKNTLKIPDWTQLNWIVICWSCKHSPGRDVILIKSCPTSPSYQQEKFKWDGSGFWFLRGIGSHSATGNLNIKSYLYANSLVFM